MFVAIVDGLDPEQLEQQVGRRVEDPDEGEKGFVEEDQRNGDGERGGPGHADRQRLGGEFPEDDVEGTDRDKPHGQGDEMRLFGREPEPDDDRFEHAGDDGLADPAQAETGEGDSQLTGREIGIKPGEDRFGHFRGPGAFTGQLFNLTESHLDEGELGGHEKAVGRQQQHDGK